MTISERVREHIAWPAYVTALDSEMPISARMCSMLIARDLGLTERQRVNLLPQIAKYKPSKRKRGRPRKPTPTIDVKCPACGAELEVTV